jgi:Na+/H+-translocating membrane pyrophosphatase
VRENGRVSNTPNSPETPEPSPAAGVDGTAAEPLETDQTTDTVTVRRAPRYGRFITLGAIVGAIVALILTFAFSGEPVEGELIEFDKGQVFGFLLLICATIGVALGALVALLIDRSTARRARSVAVVRESTHHPDE